MDRRAVTEIMAAASAREKAGPGVARPEVFQEERCYCGVDVPPLVPPVVPPLVPLVPPVPPLVPPIDPLVPPIDPLVSPEVEPDVPEVEPDVPEVEPWLPCDPELLDPLPLRPCRFDFEVLPVLLSWPVDCPEVEPAELPP